ncbi:hypothetical protein DI005_03840 [Prauserella sp. PE36]|uniref:Uncharacterized protein n=1 Tax=Prauserella endophytica TaxID=1592324 RepID=A0ABY2S4I9_9PSEU|nr:MULTISPECIES: hypothetical protein [Prauserella]PXY34332.1 hypothetical protein BAY59_01985 [Prauserella coralliicola]RBM23097.1 hypothetical protein DI005_03840 [Prauserella sp. PE36]TKG69977.1 hypothetical protein FCN18_17845 [Prauserella endophytica]
MKSKFARVVAAVATGAMLALTTAGVAAASNSGGGKGSTSTEAAGAQVLELRDQLAKVAYSGDVRGTQDTLADLDPLLADLAAGQIYTIQADAQNQAGTAKSQNSEVSEVLADPAAEPRAYTQQVPGLPPLPDPLSMVNGLLQGLLESLQALLNSLLGSVPPLPAVPEVPGVPVPVP